MALQDTEKAIGMVTKMLVSQLNTKTGQNVDVGHPGPITTGPKLNLFLYEAHFDPHLKNTSLDDGQPTPVWLVLKYLLTAFDAGGKSDSSEAHTSLGQGIRALQGLSLMPLTADADVVAALKDNPEMLKVTFEDTTSELLSKLMGGPNDEYKFSVGFQVRPVMIASTDRPDYQLLVGIDYEVEPIKAIGDEGIGLFVLPSMGPQLTAVKPSRFEVTETIKIEGTDFLGSDLTAYIGEAALTIEGQKTDKMMCKVNGTIAAGGSISAGNHPITVRQQLSATRYRVSNLIPVNLLPTLDSASHVAGNPAQVKLQGTLLGTDKDDIAVALYRGGESVILIDTFTCSSDQKTLTFNVPAGGEVTSGTYLVILRVNGQQALKSPKADLP